MKKRGYIIFTFLLSLCLLGCSASSQIQSIDQKTVYNMIQNKEDFILVDVREQNEYDEGHIPSSVLIPLGTIESDFQKIITDKQQKIVVYCRTGRRSQEAYDKIIHLGYENVYDMGGIVDWQYEIEK